MLILFIVVFVILMILIFSILQMDDSNTLQNSIISFFMSGIISFIVYIIEQSNKNDLQNCKETVALIVPEIVYANDSSFKVLKYNHKSFPEKIIINVGDSLYNMNDSDYIVEPCEQKILKKRK